MFVGTFFTGGRNHKDTKTVKRSLSSYVNRLLLPALDPIFVACFFFIPIRLKTNTLVYPAYCILLYASTDFKIIKLPYKTKHFPNTRDILKYFPNEFVPNENLICRWLIWKLFIEYTYPTVNIASAYSNRIINYCSEIVVQKRKGYSLIYSGDFRGTRKFTVSDLYSAKKVCRLSIINYITL